ncbi:MAG: hypothetical protein ACLQGJ_07365 [Candidatus Dormibacteria bacterium]
MDRPLRTFWGLAAIGGAIAVGLTTQNAAYIVITLLGGLIVPRALGLAGPGRRHGWAGRFGPGAGSGAGGHRAACVQSFWDEWHRQAHTVQPTSPPAPTA